MAGPEQFVITEFDCIFLKKTKTTTKKWFGIFLTFLKGQENESFIFFVQNEEIAGFFAFKLGHFIAHTIFLYATNTQA